MANEPLVLGRANGEWRVMFLFEPDPVKQVGGQNVVPTPATRLADDAVTRIPLLEDVAQKGLSQAEKNALDAGTLAYRVKSFRAPEGMNLVALAAKVVHDYNTVYIPLFDAWYADRYKRAGYRIPLT